MPLVEITQEAADALVSSKFDNASDAILAAMPKKKPKFNPTECVPTTVNFAAWSDWVFFRKEKRKPISKRAASMQLKMLAEYDYTTQQQIIDCSIQNDYQGLFAPKGARSGQSDILNDTSWYDELEQQLSGQSGQRDTEVADSEFSSMEELGQQRPRRIPQGLPNGINPSNDGNGRPLNGYDQAGFIEGQGE